MALSIDLLAGNAAGRGCDAFWRPDVADVDPLTSKPFPNQPRIPALEPGHSETYSVIRLRLQLRYVPCRLHGIIWQLILPFDCCGNFAALLLVFCLPFFAWTGPNMP